MLSDVVLTKLNVARENIDDTAGAAQVILFGFILPWLQVLY